MSEINRTVLLVGNDCDYFSKHHHKIAEFAIAGGYKVAVALPCRKKNVGGLLNYPFRFSKTSLNLFDAVKTIYDLTVLYHRLKPDIVHHFNIKIVFLGGIAARLAQIRAKLNTISGVGYFFHHPQKYGIYAKLIIFGLRFACGGKNIINLLYNNGDRNCLISRKIVARRRTKIINGTGVDLNIYQPSPLPTGLPIVMLPARLIYDKGITEFVQAAQIINKDKINARFVLVGKIIKNHPVAIPEKIIRRWEKNNIIEYWGDKNTMQSVYQKTNIVCLPSYYEGLPTSLVEAGASCRPIVATDIPGNRAVVNNGVNGILVPVKNATMLACAIQRLLSDIKLQKNMGIKGRKLVKEKFDSKKIAKKCLNIYKELLSVH